MQIGDFEYYFDGIFSATQVLIAATVLHFILHTAVNRKIDKETAGMCAAVVVFGGATLVFRNELFLQWKPTVFNWVLAAILLGSQFIGEKNIVERTLGSQIEAPHNIWNRLNYVWIAYFFVVGVLNLAVAYNFSEELWVKYKLFSSIGFSILQVAITMVILMPYVKEDAFDEDKASN